MDGLHYRTSLPHHAQSTGSRSPKGFTVFSSPSSKSDPITTADLLALGGYALLAGVVLAPARHYIGTMDRVEKAKARNDSFPLSTFPMFSEDRKGRLVVPHVVGLTESGERVLLHYTHYGAGGLNQVRRQIARDLRLGRALDVAQRYADSIAAERRRNSTGGSTTGAERRRRESAVARVAVVRSRFHFDDYFGGSKEPQAEVVFAECAVGGRAVLREGGPLPRHRTAVA